MFRSSFQSIFFSTSSQPLRRNVCVFCHFEDASMKCGLHSFFCCCCCCCWCLQRNPSVESQNGFPLKLGVYEIGKLSVARGTLTQWPRCTRPTQDRRSGTSDGQKWGNKEDKERRKLTRGRAEKCKLHKGRTVSQELSGNTVEEKKQGMGKRQATSPVR